METVSAAQDDGSGANPSSVKSENGSPPPDGERGSPPPNCAICLGKCRNKSFTDSCLHQFCFKCLVTWSKVKSVCPLCKQNFKSIIHNVQSNQQYEEYRVEQEEDRIDIDDLVTATRRFRYRTTLTFPRGGEQLAFHRLLMRYPPLSAMVDMSRDLPGVTPAALPSSRRRRSPSSFRRTVYRHNLWARPLPDFTGRHRDCTPEFYRYNDSQIHRLVPWLSRELTYLLLENSGHIAYVLQRILELLPQYHITSPEFREEMYRFFGSRTDHFLHELHCFAATPYDLTGYDRSVQYTTDSRVYINTVNDISSSDTDSGDSDVVEILDTSLSNRTVPYRTVDEFAAALDRPLSNRPLRTVDEFAAALDRPHSNRPLRTVDEFAAALDRPHSNRPLRTVDEFAAALDRPHNNRPLRTVDEFAAALDHPNRLPCRPVTPILTSPSCIITGHCPSSTTRAHNTRPSFCPYRDFITSPTERNRVPRESVISIQTITQSDTDDDEVMVTGYIKPPHQRTPEVVDLRDSDSDVIMTEPSPPPPPAAAPRFPVKLTLSRPRPTSPSDSDDETYTPPQPPPPYFRRPNLFSSRLSRSSHSYSSSTSSTSSSSDDEISQRNTVSQKKGKDGARNHKSKVQSSRRKRRRSKEIIRRKIALELALASTSAAANSSANDRSSPDHEHNGMRWQRKSANGKGVKSSRRNEATVESRRPEPMEVDASRSVPDSRASDNSVSSRRDNIDVERELARTTQNQEEPQPGSSSQHAERETKPRREEALELPKESLNNLGSSRSSNVGKSSRRDEPSQSKSAESRTIDRRQEPQPEATLAQIRKEIKQRRRHDGESINVNDEPQPGPSSRPDVKIKSSRKDTPSESRRDEPRTEPESSSQPRSKGKTSRRDESIESPSGSSNRSSGQAAQRDLPSETIGARSSSVHDELRPESSSRHGEKRVKSSKRDPSETRQHEPSSAESRSDAMRSNGKGSKSSRQEEPAESRASPAHSQAGPRSSGQAAQRDLPSETIGARSSSVHDELRPESSSRHGEKRVKSSKRDLSETRQHEPSSAESRSDAMRSNGKGSKSSRQEEPAESRASPAHAQAGPSQAGPSNIKRKSSDEIPTRREHKRLKSVVKKASGSNTAVSIPSSVSNASRKPPFSPDSTSDSDDDIPLNLTLRLSKWTRNPYEGL